MFFCQKNTFYDGIFFISFFRRSKYAQSIRSKFSHLSIKKNIKHFWKWKKLEQLFEKNLKILRFLIFSKIFMIFENFDFFRKFSLKIPTKIFDLKNFRKNHENFRKNQKYHFFSKNFPNFALTFFIFNIFSRFFYGSR